jgi:DNA-binding XRE family transcriptional regulator
MAFPRFRRGKKTWEPSQVKDSWRSREIYESSSMKKCANDVIKDGLGRKIRQLRLSLKMSQMELAKKAETDQAFISEMERGVANPTLDSILRIAKALRVDIVALFQS